MQALLGARMDDTRQGERERLRGVLLGILDEAIAAVGAQFGSLQLYDAGSGALELVTHRGFPDEVAESFRVIPCSAGTTCARAWRAARRLVVSSLAEDPNFAPYLPLAERCGFRAVQSTPIPGATQPIGVMSTHFASKRAPTLAESVLLDHCAERAARALTQFAAAA
jgi:GAF domain-containing protein